MPQEEPSQEEPGNEVKKRAIKRVAAAILLALAAAGGLTMLSRSHKPTPQAQQTVLPAEPAAAVEQPASAVEPVAAEPASAVVETAPEHDAPPTTNAPPPPQVINPPQPASETPHKAARSLGAKPNQELVVSSKEAVKEALAKANITPSAKPAEEKVAPMQAKVLELAKPAEAKKPPAEPQKTVELVKPAEKTPPPPPPQASQAAPKNYAVQLGVFSNPANATQMQEKLAQNGIKSYTETRLNVGPFQSKTEAEQALAKLRGMGISAVVVPLSK